MIPFYIPWKQEVQNRNIGKKLVNTRKNSRSIFFQSIIQCLKNCSERLHIESSPLICNANQLTDFYMKGLHNILRHYQGYWKKNKKNKKMKSQSFGNKTFKRNWEQSPQWNMLLTREKWENSLFRNFHVDDYRILFKTFPLCAPPSPSFLLGGGEEGLNFLLNFQ